MPPPSDSARPSPAPLRSGWDRATLALLVVALAIVATTFRDFGATWDEEFQRHIGQATLAWWGTAGADSRALGGGDTGNFNLYGGLFDATAELAAAALPFDAMESRHLFNACVALLGVAGASLLARRIGGARAGFLAAALLLTTPAWWGHSFVNPKDVPFAAPYPWILLTLLAAADAFPALPARRAVPAGLALGLGLAARPGGLVLLLPLALGILAARACLALRRLAPGDRAPALRAFSARCAAVAAVAWAVMSVGWPYGLVHPLSGPAEAIAAARAHPWDGLVRFAGEWHRSTDLPWSYAPTLLAATLPESWFVAAAAGTVAGGLAAARAWRSRRAPSLAAWLDRALVAAAGLGPILAVVLTRPVLYDGIRHLLFVVPALAALGGFALSFALDRLPRWAGLAALGAATAAGAVAVSDMASLHPYEYAHFNRAVAGGLGEASHEFELDYWGASTREGMTWVVRNVTPPVDRPLRVKATAQTFVAAHWIEDDPVGRARFTFDEDGPADLLLATTRWFDHRTPGKVLHVVERMGVPLLYVLDVSPTGGPRVLEGGDLAIEVTLPPGWSGQPIVEPGDDTAVYHLRREWPPEEELRLSIVSPAHALVPTVEALRTAVEGRVRDFIGHRAGGGQAAPVVAQGARGWIASVKEDSSDTSGERPTLLSAVRVGPAAVYFEARSPTATDPGGEVLAIVRSVRMARDRRRP